MSEEYLLKLTLAVYKVTELFPEEEIKYQIRDSANRVLADLLCNRLRYSDQINKLINLFDLAEARNFVDPRNFLVLRREYQKLALDGNRKSAFPLEGRQAKILDYIKNNGQTPLRTLHQLFPAVHRRTLIRDLDKLCQAGLVIRNGNGRGIYYTIKT